MPRTRPPIKARPGGTRRARGRAAGANDVALGSAAAGAGPQPGPRPVRGRRLGRYRNATGRNREVVALAGVDGSVLVVDRDAAGGGEQRLLAHLAADEPRATPSSSAGTT
jgi:hypothetical protein